MGMAKLWAFHKITPREEQVKTITLKIFSE
jgi:hypothetical protein